MRFNFLGPHAQAFYPDRARLRHPAIGELDLAFEGSSHPATRCP
jgi:hypothetical protein